MSRERKARHDARRPSSSQRGYTSRWEQERNGFLAQPENRFCACGCGRRANTVDHKRPHKGDQSLFWDKSNWQALNAHCHNSTKQRQERRASMR